MFLLLLFDILITTAWLKLKLQLKFIIFFILKTEVINKGKSFRCALVSEAMCLFKYVFICFSFLNIFVTATTLLATKNSVGGNRGYYMAVRRYEISLRVLKNIFFNTRGKISYFQATM